MKLGELEEALSIAVHFASIAGIVLALGAFVFGCWEYHRNQAWKRAEFIATEWRGFQDRPLVRCARMLIDWGFRRIELPVQGCREPVAVEVTRGLQWRALLPHSIKPSFPDRLLGDDQRDQRFTDREAAIRDAYDAFLGGLEHFNATITVGLISQRELKSYLGYWLSSIADFDTKDMSADDVRWRYVLLVYIKVYGFDGVKQLFDRFGFDISLRGSLAEGLRSELNHEELERELMKLLASENSE